MTAENFQLLVSDDWRDYELLDSGDMRKLERFGKVRVNRPDPQALWKPKTPVASWKADATFASKDDEDERGAWSFAGKPPPDEWPIAWNTLKLNARLAAFRHMGVFPEHSVHWRWAADQVKAAKRPVKALNLFGYTGMMSLALAQARAEVVHLDAEKPEAAARWPVEAADDVHGRGLAGARRAHDGNELAPVDGQVDACQRPHQPAALAIGARDAGEGDERVVARHDPAALDEMMTCSPAFTSPDRISVSLPSVTPA